MQWWMELAPTVEEKVWRGHDVQSSGDDACDMLLYVPAGHEKHRSSPWLLLYRPGAHGRQASEELAP
jgi:hypothetical protein